MTPDTTAAGLDLPRNGLLEHQHLQGAQKAGDCEKIDFIIELTFIKSFFLLRPVMLDVMV
jgi:hypothetical protein